MPLTFRLARDPRDREQLHGLHYNAFVEEIPQHAPNAERRHVDGFHDENVYFVAVENERVIGSVALRAHRPFSLDRKLADLDAWLPPNRRFCELRLLNVAKEHRSGSVLPGLMSLLWEYVRDERFDGALISATTRQLKLYAHMGFVPFGPLVGTSDAPFQPMYLTVEAFAERAREISSLPPAARGEAVSLLPGPVTPHADVAAAFAERPVSHRSAVFDDELREVKRRLCALTGARNAVVLLGSGTLANDAVAAQLALRGGRGVVVSNGEFGERLIDQASRAALDATPLRFGWGEAVDLDAVRRALDDTAAEWLWVVACETSTGVLNDVASISALCAPRGVRLCVDAVSAVGAVPVDLSDVWLATSTSGKALGAYPGLAVVFHREPVAAGASLPRYLDLGLYVRDAVPFTHSSNLVRALRVALARVEWEARHEQIASAGARLRSRLAAAGLELIGRAAVAAPHVVTIALRGDVSSDDAARTLERAGFLVAHASGYLRERNWIQLALMGEVASDVFTPLVRELSRFR